MTTVARVLAVLAFFAFGLVGPAAAEKRVALVVGNSSYEHTSVLKNPKNDAGAVSAALRQLGFEVLEGRDLDDQTFRRMARDFTVKSEDADVALFFYAGHGLQVNGRNFLLPVNASLKREIDLEFEAMPLELIMTHMERGERTNIVLLDACRNNPLAEHLARSMGTRSATIGRGLARVETGVGTYVGFSTQPGNVALDGEGDNSPFAEAFVKHIATPGLDIETLMRQVREEVIRATGGRQVPWGNSSLVGRGFVFKAAIEVAEAQPEVKERTAPQSAITDQANIEIAYWNSIKDAGDPKLLEAYLNEYPNGRFARLADILIENLAARDTAAAPKKVEQKPTPLAPKAASDTPSPAAEAKPSSEGSPPQKLAAVEPKQQAVEADPAEAGFWLAVKETRDRKLIEAYLKRYPKGAFVKDAKALLDSLRKREAALPGKVEEEATPKPEAVETAPEPEAAPEPEEAAPVKPKPGKAKTPAVEKKRKQPEPAPRKARKKEPAKVQKKQPVKVEKKRKRAPVVAVSEPAFTPAPQPKRENCGWCTFGRSQTTMLCGREFESMRAANKCR